jgi:hypothetical protein
MRRHLAASQRRYQSLLHGGEASRAARV